MGVSRGLYEIFNAHFVGSVPLDAVDEIYDPSGIMIEGFLRQEAGKQFDYDRTEENVVRDILLRMQKGRRLFNRLPFRVRDMELRRIFRG